MTNSNINNLKDFLTQTVTLLDTIVNQWRDLLIPQDYREPLGAAWEELKPRIDRDIAEFNPQSYDTKEKLEIAGLTGAQLDFKLKVLNDAWERFRKFGTVKLLKKVLDWINKILKSLLGAIPGADALEEIKSFIEGVTDDDDED